VGDVPVGQGHGLDSSPPSNFEVKNKLCCCTHYLAYPYMLTQSKNERKKAANVGVANVLFITDKLSVRLNNIQTPSLLNIAGRHSCQE